MGNKNSEQSSLRLYAMCGLMLAASGCATSLQVDSTFPQPVVASLPINIGIYYDESLRQYAFEKEANANSVAWNIEIGAAHVRLFDQLFGSIFANPVQVEGLGPDTADTPVSVVLKPSINGYSLHTPLDTTTDFYEVEIRYNLTFYSPSGDYIQQWSYTGQGKSRSELFSTEEPVHKATVAAMRDAAAWLVVELTKHPDFHTLLQAQQSDGTAKPDNSDS